MRSPFLLQKHLIFTLPFLPPRPAPRPGEVLGCGRPFRFPDDSGTGLFVTWADEITGELHPSSVDVTGDYSIATRDLQV
jgi:hypothetical protein